MNKHTKTNVNRNHRSKSTNYKEKMTVHKFICICAFKVLGKIRGRHFGDYYISALALCWINFLFLFGCSFLLQAFIGIGEENQYIISLLTFGAMIVMERYHNHYFNRDGAFERIKKEVEAEPRKKYWRLLSIMYILGAFTFAIVSLYINIVYF